MALPRLDLHRLTWIFVALGLALRIWHYLNNHTIWYDEAVLLANILNKDYAELLGPLNHAVAAPPIYLWILKLVSVVCGDQAYCWRFVSFVCGCATLLLTAPLVRMVLSPPVAAISVALVAFSDNHIWLTCCIKPYAGDALIATALLYFYFATERWSATRRLTVLTLAIPPILCTSYSAPFVIGGLLLALLPFAYRERPRGMAMWCVASLAALATFACLYFGPIRNQRVEGLVLEWERMYPDLHRPQTLPWWVVEHTSTIFQFCYMPVGFYLFAVAPLGLLAVWRAGRRDRVILLAAPFLLAMFAAALKSYPYGFNRLMFFAAPCVLLLGGFGMEVAFQRFPGKRTFLVTATLLILISLVVPVSRFFLGWEQPDSSGNAAYIRAHRAQGDIVASDEQTYVYFFRGELRSLNDIAAANLPAGARIWVPMDHYNQAMRLEYVTGKLASDRFELLETTHFETSCAFLFVKRK